ncbi:MAG: radical SAM protein [Bacteroidales bacterium]
MKKESELMIERNQQEYVDFYDKLCFATSEQLLNANKERNQIINAVQNSIKWGFNESKLDCNQISQGCELCGRGYWSCLFINGVCNANCFYCPTGQQDVSVPTTNTLEFPNVNDYIEYIKKFGFKGVSISGGEPLLTFEKTWEYIDAVRKNFGDSIYIWMYTNGILATEEKLIKLKEAGLNEIRFDLSADNYKLDAIKLAVGIIENVTVEIPTIPEDFEVLKNLIKELKAIGVNYLNLHQIRCTPFNYKNLVNKGYTFLHGPKIVVLESELTALRLIKYNIDNKINLPINYCSFIYKYRFQNRAARIRHAKEICNAYEEITITGLIRNLMVKDSPDKINHIIKIFERNHVDMNLWSINYHKDTLIFHSNLWSIINEANFDVVVNYFSTAIRPSISYRYLFKEIKLDSGKNFFIEKGLTHRILLDDHVKKEIFYQLFIDSGKTELRKTNLESHIKEINTESLISNDLILLFNEVFDYELLDYGLYPYY